MKRTTLLCSAVAMSALLLTVGSVVGDTQPPMGPAPGGVTDPSSVRPARLPDEPIPLPRIGDYHSSDCLGVPPFDTMPCQEEDVITLTVRDHALHIQVADDGDGGANPAGSGLTGLRQRVEALDGSLTVLSEEGAGTTIRARLPYVG